MSELELLHTVHLEIADEFHRICDENHLNYFLVAGTLLGAVRHEGFIPWDDDFDVGMIRDDYEKLIHVLDDALDDQFYYITMENNNFYSLPFLKIMKKNTELREKNVPIELNDYGIFIDVFPFDNVPDRTIEKISHQLKTSVYKKMLVVRNNYKLNLNNPIKKLAYQVIKIINKFFSNESLKQNLLKECKRYNSKTTQHITNIGGAYGYTHETIPVELTFKLTQYAFEGRKYYSFENYDKYLKGFYGEYMKLPPKSQRGNRHEYEYIIFDKEVNNND